MGTAYYGYKSADDFFAMQINCEVTVVSSVMSQSTLLFQKKTPGVKTQAILVIYSKNTTLLIDQCILACGLYQGHPLNT